MLMYWTESVIQLKQFKNLLFFHPNISCVVTGADKTSPICEPKRSVLA